VLLAGTTPGIKHRVVADGQLRAGQVTTEPYVRRVPRSTLFWAALSFLMVGALTIVLLVNNSGSLTKRPDGLVCVAGALTVEGSSAFGLVATKAAGSYHAFCPESTVNVFTPGSLGGLNRLRDAPESSRPDRLALVDGLADREDYPGLVAHPLAVLPFTFAVNSKVPVGNITRDQARAIFTGTASRWSDITGNPRDNVEIRVIGRNSASGTRRTLEQYVLSAPGNPVTQAVASSDSCLDRRKGFDTASAVVCEQASTSDVVNKVATVDYSIGYADVADVLLASTVRPLTLDGRGTSIDDLRAGYPFWTVEYVYSHGQSPPDSLAAAFTDFLRGPAGNDTMSSFNLTACGRPHNPTATLCSSGR
jgi:phosphate transport system substrate-binding protein